MNIDDAVRVLNERRYDIDEWRDAEWTKEGGEGTVLLVDKGERDQWDYHESLDEFEAIAIAEKLDRDAGREAAALRRHREALNLDAVMPLLEAIAGHADGPGDRDSVVDYLSLTDLDGVPTTYGDVHAVVAAWKARRQPC